MERWPHEAAVTLEQRKYFHNTGRCPYCHGSKFYEGPQGGLCINIECATCGARFNIAAWPLGPLMVCDLLGAPTHPEKVLGVEMDAEENRNMRRDKKTWNRKYGMRVVGQSVKRLAEVIRKRSEKKVP